MSSCDFPSQNPFFLREFWLFGSLNAEIASDNHCDCPILVAGARIIHKVQEPRIRSLSSESLGEKWGAWVGGGLDVQIWAFPVLFFQRELTGTRRKRPAGFSSFSLVLAAFHL